MHHWFLNEFTWLAGSLRWSAASTAATCDVFFGPCETNKMPGDFFEFCEWNTISLEEVNAAAQPRMNFLLFFFLFVCAVSLLAHHFVRCDPRCERYRKNQLHGWEDLQIKHEMHDRSRIAMVLQSPFAIANKSHRNQICAAAVENSLVSFA